MVPAFWLSNSIEDKRVRFLHEPKRGCHGRYKIKLVLVPKEAHYRLGTIERLHAVRRLQLLKMKKEVPDIPLETAIRVACEQRNRLCNVHGSSPAEMVFGRAPNAVEGLLDEPVDLRPKLPVAVQENVAFGPSMLQQPRHFMLPTIIHSFVVHFLPGHVDFLLEARRSKVRTFTLALPSCA